MTRIGRAARDRAQGGRTIEPAEDFQARVAAERTLDCALKRTAVRAEQTISLFLQLRLLLGLIQKTLHGVEQGKAMGFHHHAVGALRQLSARAIAGWTSESQAAVTSKTGTVIFAGS